MKNIKFILVAFIAVSLVSCKAEQKKTQEVIEVISIDELKAVDSSAQLIDVRTPKEYEGGYISNAKNVDFKSDDFLEQMSQLDKSKPVYVYCMAGVRSGMSAEKLKEAGFTKVYDYKGGFGEWKSSGNKITSNQ